MKKIILILVLLFSFSYCDEEELGRKLVERLVKNGNHIEDIDRVLPTAIDFFDLHSNETIQNVVLCFVAMKLGKLKIEECNKNALIQYHKYHKDFSDEDSLLLLNIYTHIGIIWLEDNGYL